MIYLYNKSEPGGHMPVRSIANDWCYQQSFNSNSLHLPLYNIAQSPTCEKIKITY